MCESKWMFALTYLTYSLLATVAKFLIIYLFFTILFDLVVYEKRKTSSYWNWVIKYAHISLLKKISCLWIYAFFSCYVCLCVRILYQLTSRNLSYFSECTIIGIPLPTQRFHQAWKLFVLFCEEILTANSNSDF